MARFLAAFLLFVLLVGTVSAQSIPINVKWIDRDVTDEFRELNREIARALQSELEWRGFAKEGQGLDLFFRAQELPTSEGSIVVLSLVESMSLREPVVEAGAKSQIWYADSPRPENEDEARFVREYMTREVLSELVQIQNIIQLAFPKAEMAIALSSYFDDLTERRTCTFNDGQCG